MYVNRGHMKQNRGFPNDFVVIFSVFCLQRKFFLKDINTIIPSKNLSSHNYYYNTHILLHTFAISRKYYFDIFFPSPTSTRALCFVWNHFCLHIHTHFIKLIQINAFSRDIL